MSNTIPPFSQPGLPEATNGQASGQTSVAAGAPPAATAANLSAATAANQPAAARDSVTLSAAAQSGAQLLGAAQNAAGIDHAAVANIRAQLAAGSYNVSPENLAQAIATVLKETKS